MTVTRGGYVIINLEKYRFDFNQGESEYKPVEVEDEIIRLIKYAYNTGKPICINNIRNTDENGADNIFTAEYGTVTPIPYSDEYYIPRFKVVINEKTLTWRD